MILVFWPVACSSDSATREAGARDARPLRLQTTRSVSPGGGRCARLPSSLETSAFSVISGSRLRQGRGRVWRCCGHLGPTDWEGLERLWPSESSPVRSPQNASLSLLRSPGTPQTFCSCPHVCWCFLGLAWKEACKLTRF